MAAIVEPSNGNAFWQQWFDRHAKAKTIYEGLRLVGRYVGRFLDFVFNGHILVSFVRWLVRVTGYTAESALMLAVLWITITSVAPMFVTLFMDQITMAKSISFTVIVLAIIPELILINALTNVIEHWLRVIQGNYQSRTARVFSWIWAIAFTIPTCLFLYLTSVTIHNVQATGNFVQATTSMIDLRCYAGWAYAVLETLYATTRVGKRMMEGVADEDTEIAPAPRINVKLAPERKRAKSSAKREPAKSSGTAQEKALRILKKYPDINAAELAKKAQITPQYASRILKKLSV